ncbi:MAG TPA: hypothetical protein VFJ43_04600 [Bacteroidia bacterium]|nr:hypothetical protein [Bacteroidia bacterium]
MKPSTLFLMPLAIICIALTCAFIQTSDSCDVKTYKDNAKAALDPFKYDSGKVTRLYYKKKEQVKEFEIPVFVGEKYKVVWNTEGISRNVTITVYNKDKDSKNRKEMFSATATPGEKIHSYEPVGAKFKFYVDYTLPGVNDSLPPSECMVMMLGYK